jgi:hypothetical protein
MESNQIKYRKDRTMKTKTILAAALVSALAATSAFAQGLPNQPKK